MFFDTSTLPKNAASQMQEALRKARKELNTKDIRIHDLRRSYCTHLYNQGSEISAIQKLITHSTMAITEENYIRKDLLKL
jgi:integrase